MDEVTGKEDSSELRCQNLETQVEHADRPSNRHEAFGFPPKMEVRELKHIENSALAT